jgi:hypothetical protein
VTVAADQRGTDESTCPAVETVEIDIDTLIFAALHFPDRAASATDPGTARNVGYAAVLGAVIAARAAIGDIAVEVEALAIAA